MIVAGIDMGSRSIKVALLDADAPAAPRLLAQHLMFPGALDLDAAAERAYAEALGLAGLTATDVRQVMATGAGRKLVRFATADVTEMSAGARGAAWVCPGVTTVIDVGAEEGRGIKVNDAGRALDFAANEKCAAGAGAFAESMARALELDLAAFGAASLRSQCAIPMNAQCTVFAESEVVSLIHAATPKEDIARAVLDAVASRVCAMVRRVGIDGEVLLIGGMVHNPGFVQALQAALGVPLRLAAQPEFVGAIGAALLAAESAPAFESGAGEAR